MMKKFIRKYCGVVLFYLAIVGVAYIICSCNIIHTRTNNNSLTIGVNK